MLYAKTEFIPYLLLIFTLMFLGGTYILVTNLYKKEAMKKWGSNLMVLFNRNLVFKSILLGVTIISLILYLLFTNQIYLLIFLVGFGLIIALSFYYIIAQLCFKINTIEDKTVHPIFYSIVNISLLSILNLFFIGIFFILSNNFKIPLLDNSYALITLALTVNISLFYKQSELKIKVIKSILINSSLFLLGLVSSIITLSYQFTTSSTHLLFFITFITISLLVMLITSIATFITIKDKKEEEKVDTIKMYSYCGIIILGIIFLPLSYTYFKGLDTNKMGGFDLGFLILIALVLQLGLTSTIDSIQKHKYTHLYFNILALLCGGILLILITYITSVWGYLFAATGVILFNSFMTLLLKDKDSTSININIGGILLSIGAIFLVEKLFYLDAQSNLTTLLTINYIVPFIIGVCLSLFVSINSVDRETGYKWLASYILLITITIILINMIFGFSGVISLFIAYTLIMIMNNETDLILYDRLYLVSIYIGISLILVEVLNFLNLGVGLI